MVERVVELAQVQGERGQHAHVEGAGGDPPRAHGQHDDQGDVAGQSDAPGEPGDRGHGGDVGVAVLVVEVGQDGLVAGLPAERLHRAHPVHGLHELHDDLGHRTPGAPVGPPRAVLEPPGQQHQREEPGQHDQRGRQVEPEQQADDADDGDDRAEEPVQAHVEQVVERVHVGGEPGDDLARGVGLVEGHGQLLGVPEHALPQVEQEVLADPAGQPDERVAQQRGQQPRAEVAADAPGQRRRPPGKGRWHALVDGRGDEQRAEQAAQALREHDDHGQQRPPQVRAQQRAQQPAGPGLELQPGAPVEFLDVLGGHPAPGLVPGRRGAGSRCRGRGRGRGRRRLDLGHCAATSVVSRFSPEPAGDSSVGDGPAGDSSAGDRSVASRWR